MIVYVNDPKVDTNDALSRLELNLSKGTEDLKVLYATGIVNPNGPTLCTYYIDPAAVIDDIKVYEITTHPTGSAGFSVGHIFWNDDELEFERIEFHKDFFGDSMPTLFMKGEILSDTLFKALITSYIENIKNARQTFQLINKYPGNPVKRVTAEIELVSDLITDKVSKKHQSFFQTLTQPKPVDNYLDKNKFIKLLTDKTNINKEISAFFKAYSGSIHNVIPPSMVQVDMRSFLEIFVSICFQCEIDPLKLKLR